MTSRHRGPIPLGRTVAALLVVLALAAALLVRPEPAGAGPTGSFVNDARGSSGLAPLEEHSGLDGIAGDHARAMAARGSLYHLANLDDVVGSVVSNWTRVGQNVGAGSSLAEVESLMMASSQHRANILGDYTLMGSGAVTDGTGRVWVAQVFAKAGAAPPATTATTRAAPPVTQAPEPASPVPVERSAAPRASRTAPRAAPVIPPTEDDTADEPAALGIADQGIVGVASTPTRTRPAWWDGWWPWPSRPAYWLAGADGGVFAYGRARYLQSLAGHALNAPVVGLAALRDGKGYWLATADGGVFAFGRAPFLSSAAGAHLRAPIRALAANRAGTGYWLVSADGGVFAFGQAPYLGSLAGEDVDGPVVAMASTPSGGGYWLATAAGAVYAFGDAGYAGGLTGDDLAAPIVGLEATPSGRGYRLVSADGGVFAFGDASFEGSLSGRRLNARVIALDTTPSGRGYRLVSADGGVFAFGDAAFAGSVAGRPLNAWRPLR